MTDANDSALIALLRGTTLPWTDIASRVKAAGSAVAVMNTELGHPDPRDDWGDDDVTPLALFPQQPTPEQTQRLQAAHEEAVTLLDQWRKQGLRFLSLLNPEYPQQLREIFDLPPFLFAQGTLVANDRGVSVIGSRLASHDGMQPLMRRQSKVVGGQLPSLVQASHNDIQHKTLDFKTLLPARGTFLTILAGSAANKMDFSAPQRLDEWLWNCLYYR